MSDNFYRAFEEKYRGSCELITQRLRIYLPFIYPLKNIYPIAPTIDLGCGRGEWLKLLSLEGFCSYGVDQDEGMLENCLDQNLSVEKGDIIEYLSKISDESQTIVSAFHVVEHITFDQLRTLVSEALRVLKPGGLLIMETPNPENIIVATRNFYLDPTHKRPIPPELLAFLPEYYGFLRAKIIRLQETKELTDNLSPKLQDVFSGVSPDYAVIAQKTASSDIISSFNDVFSQEFGLRFDTLTERYDAVYPTMIRQLEANIEELNTKVRQLKVKIDHVEVKTEPLEAKVDQTESKIEYLTAQVVQLEINAHQSESRVEHLAEMVEQLGVSVEQTKTKLEKVEFNSQECLTQLQTIYNSKSWRITKPFRYIYCTFFNSRRKTVLSSSQLKSKKFLLNMLTFFVKKGDVYTRQLPYLRSIVLRILRNLPWLSTKLREIKLRSQFSTIQSSSVVSNSQKNIVKQQIETISMQLSKQDGINTDQRSPLEKNYQMYGDEK